jgi:hypothetical protein
MKKASIKVQQDLSQEPSKDLPNILGHNVNKRIGVLWLA